ncbi:hypothetical protein HC031_02250 [Planosporangium thailandense]|uniref:GTPase activator n=1 Tax=Planosporangium thailandense TaxID=765197 RepID=A0ABX0XRC2_9ACTN|nr:hypothetical protein [Planosporangium thailandense]NJC68550.1 hypothetical protein [Planosporangium thailandense]
MDHHDDRVDTGVPDGPTQGRAIDPRSDEELRETRDAQRAHDGSMAPGLVDATGHQVADVPPTGGARRDDG